jgi:hypothetical protein
LNFVAWSNGKILLVGIVAPRGIDSCPVCSPCLCQHVKRSVAENGMISQNSERGFRVSSHRFIPGIRNAD